MLIRNICMFAASVSLAFPLQTHASETPLAARDGVIEICAERGSTTGCFIETREAGRSRFFADDHSLDLLLTDRYISRLPFEFNSISEGQYKMLQATVIQHAFVNLETTGFSIGATENCGNDNGVGQCVAGTIGGAMLGGLSGAGFGPIGIGVGIIGGGLAGSAASGCWNDGNCDPSSGGESKGGSDGKGGGDTGPSSGEKPSLGGRGENAAGPTR